MSAAAVAPRCGRSPAIAASSVPTARCPARRSSNNGGPLNRPTTIPASPAPRGARRDRGSRCCGRRATRCVRPRSRRRARRAGSPTSRVRLPMRTRRAAAVAAMAGITPPFGLTLVSRSRPCETPAARRAATNMPSAVVEYIGAFKHALVNALARRCRRWDESQDAVELGMLAPVRLLQYRPPPSSCAPPDGMFE